MQRLSIWGNQLEVLPESLCSCNALVGLQAQENKLTALPESPWPQTLETLFLQSNGPTFALPASLAKNAKLKRVNLVRSSKHIHTLPST